MKKPFLHALVAVLYIVCLVSIIFFGGQVFHIEEDTIIIPMVMLTLFVLSAAVIGFLFLSEPIALLIEKRKQEAVTFFGWTVAYFACFLCLLVSALLVTSYLL